MEALQDQVVVRVVPCVTYRYILEKKTIYVQDVVGPGAHLPAALVHSPCVAILQPQLVQWDKVASHVLQVLLHQGRCNPLVPLPYLWYRKVGVEMANHQQRNPPGSLSDGCDEVLYGRGVVRGQSSPHDIPPTVA